MRLTWKDAGATLLIGAVVGLYAAYLAGVDVAFVASPRALAGIAIGLGLAACIVGAELPAASTDAPGDRRATAFAALGAAAFVVAVIAMIWASGLFLGVLVAILTLMWLATTVRHALGGRTRYRVTDADLRRLTEPERPLARPDTRVTR